MATTSVPHRWKYDVFVSFRGEDIRKNFMDHLFNDFKQKGIYAFRDDDKLPKGEEISPHLYKAIEESRFLIVIFSKNYASSTWCLRELVKILECKQFETPKHEVRIIFYDAKPDVVRKQKRSYAEAFRNHEVSNSAEVSKWKEALSMAADLSGFDLQDMTNGYESKFIDNISKEILKVISDGPLDVAENLVGVDSRVRELNLLRFVGSDKVHMIGICGFSGIGKTTLAKAIYNSMYTYFEGRCFCEDVQGVTKRQGLTHVQMQMFVNIMKTKNLKISSVSEGTKLIKQRMACKPILLVLDDVNDLEQLDALAGSPDWFSPGSLIIFTGKDKQLLWSHKVFEIYEMEILDHYIALELFSLNAFGKRFPTEGFETIASQIVKYLQGHPLALKVVGRSLYRKSMHVWRSEMDRLQTYPNSEIVQKLRPSFDSLASDQKRMFLDIACAFIGENKDFAASVLHSSDCSANAIFEVLVDKFLITVSANTMSLQMHELIQSMARELLREESSMPGNQTRLWISPEDYDVLGVNKVTEEVELLVVFLKKNCHNIRIGNAITRMKNLRILKICFPYVGGEWQPFAVKFSGRLDFLSNKLRLLYWHGMPLQFLPSDFYPENIVAIDFSYSHIKHLWTTPKYFKSLKIMKLRHCCNLTTTPDFSEIRNLEELSLEGCVNLVSVHSSVGMLKRLVVLNLRDCKRLQIFPSRVEMDTRQDLNLSGCLNVTQLPKTFWSRWWTSIPGFIRNQQHPQRSLSIAGLHMLKDLDLNYCNLELVPDSIGGLSCLEELYLSGNNFTSLPASLSQLSRLEWLSIDDCKKLEMLTELPPSNKLEMSAFDCPSLREVSGSSKDQSRYRNNDFRKCPKLFKKVTTDSEGSTTKTECLDDSCITSQGFIHQVSAFLGYLGFHTHTNEFFRPPTNDFVRLKLLYHGHSMPEWFTNRSTKKHVKIELPSDWCYDKFRGYGFCAVFKCKKPFSSFEGYYVKNFDGALIAEDFILSHTRPMGEFWKDELIWLNYSRDTRGWEEAKNFVTFGFQKDNEDVEVKEWGVRLICDEDIQQGTDLMSLPTPTQHGGILSLGGEDAHLYWSW